MPDTPIKYVLGDDSRALIRETVQQVINNEVETLTENILDSLCIDLALKDDGVFEILVVDEGSGLEVRKLLAGLLDSEIQYQYESDDPLAANRLDRFAGMLTYYAEKAQEMAKKCREEP